jgi:hypothetical protein
MKRITLIITAIILLIGGGWFAYQTYAQEQDTCKVYKIDTWNGCEPIIETAGIISTDKYSAIVQAVFNSNNASYYIKDNPKLGIEYGIARNGDFEYSTELEAQSQGVRQKSFLLNGLTQGETYAYRAVLYWPGGVKKGTVKEFTPGTQTLGTGGANNPTGVSSNTSTTTNSSSSSNTTNTTTGNNTNQSGNTNSSGPVTLSPFGNLFGNKKTTTTKSIYNSTDEKSGFRLAIDNGETIVGQGDLVTIKARYENNNVKSFENGEVKIYLPNQYTFVSTNKGVHDRISNTVVVSLREFPAGSYGTVIVSARAAGKPGTIDQVLTQATLIIGKTTLQVADADEYQASSGHVKSTGSASGSTGTGFLPGTLIGWIVLLIVLALIVVIGRRYFIKKDY